MTHMLVWGIIALETNWMQTLPTPPSVDVPDSGRSKPPSCLLKSALLLNSQFCTAVAITQQLNNKLEVLVHLTSVMRL